MTDPKSIRSYRDLRVWTEAMELAADAYRVTRSFPREEVFGLTSQIRRAAASIPANIAEGYGRESSGNYVNFLKNAQGSLKELETHLLLSVKVELTLSRDVEPLMERAESVGKMLRGLMRSVQQSGASS